MRILLHADAVGGVLTYALELARALVGRGAEVVLATEGAPLADDQARAVAAIPGVEHHGASWRLEWMDEPWDDVARSGEWLLELERRTRPDLVHLDAFAHGALPFRAPRLVVGHSCVSSWFEAVRGAAAGPEWERYRRAVRAGLAGATAVAAPSEAMARALRRHHGARHVAVIPNGRDPARFPPGPKLPLVMGAGRLWDEAKNAAALAAVAEDVPWAVVIAGDTARPGVATLAGRPSTGSGRAGGERGSTSTAPRDTDPFAPGVAARVTAPRGGGAAASIGNAASTSSDSVRPERSDPRSGARGRGTAASSDPVRPERSDPRSGARGRGAPALIRDATSSDSVRPERSDPRSGARSRGAPASPAALPGHRPAILLGRLPESALARWLSRAAIFAHPARYEPFGLAVLEAALAGCALVLGDLPSLRETWDGAAAFVPPDDRAALAAAVRALAHDDAARAGLARAARARALALSPGRMADAYLALYRRMGAAAPELHP